MPAKTAPFPTPAAARQVLADAQEHLAAVQARVKANDPTAIPELRPAEQAVDDARLLLEQAERVDQLRRDGENITAAQAELDWLNGPELTTLVDTYLDARRRSVDAAVEAMRAWAALVTGARQHLGHVRALARSGPLPADVEVVESGYGSFTVATPAGVWNSDGLKFNDTPEDVDLDEARSIFRGRPPRATMLSRVNRWLARGRGTAPARRDDPPPAAA